MFRWYQDAAKCFVYLSDVSTGKHDRSSNILWEQAFRKSRWFTRGWTLQELLAPRTVDFFSKEGKHLGSKSSLRQQVHETTGIAVEGLQGHLSQFSYNERRAWAEKRKTKYEEDQVYCLLGLFNVFLPLNYGEGKKYALRRLQDEIDRRPRDIQGNWNNEERECMQALRNSAFDYEQFKDRNPSRLEGTCQWVLRHENFQAWRDSRSSSLLWISADPGCGKSVLSKSLVEDFRSTNIYTVCHFFFKDDNDVQKQVVTALSALLHQLFSQKPTLIKHAMSHFAANGDKISQSFHTLWSILTHAVADSSAGEVICILDALDECLEVERYQIIDALSTLFQQIPFKENASQLKFLVTSRPYLDIERHFTNLISNFPTIRLQGEKELDTISSEIDTVIKWRVLQLGSELKLNNSEKAALEKQLLRMTHRTYLWLKLILDIIRKTIRLTSRKLENIIDTLPPTINNAYEVILSRIEEAEQPQARKLLQIIVTATRPLTLKEMNIALAIEEHHRCHDDLDLEDEFRFESSVKNLCGLFISVVDQKVHLIHQTAKEFLIARGEVASCGWRYSINPLESENLMARICITYLSFNEFESTTNKISGAKYGYLEYAAGSWAAHFEKAQYSATKSMLDLVVGVCDPRSQRFKTWFDLYWDMLDKWYANPKFTNTLAIESYFGHETVVKLLLEAKADTESKDTTYGRTPLSWAAENGHEAVVKLLIEAKSDTESKNTYGRTPLLWATRNKHEAVVKLLLEAKADTESKDTTYGQTPLSWAAENGRETVVKLSVDAKTPSQ